MSIPAELFHNIAGHGSHREGSQHRAEQTKIVSAEAPTDEQTRIATQADDEGCDWKKGAYHENNCKAVDIRRVSVVGRRP